MPTPVAPPHAAGISEPKSPQPVAHESDPFRLDGKVALITGASRGIGRSIALEFARAGCAGLVLSARGEDLLNEAVTEAQQHTPEAVGITGDMTDENSVATMVEAALRRFGRIDLLVNNVGGASFRSPLKDIRPSGWERMIRLNLTSTFLVSRTVLSAEGASQAPESILNIGSTSALGSFEGLSYYTASKHGLVGLTRTLARELAPTGTRVNLLCPHLVETDLSASYRKGMDEGVSLVDDIPLGRWGELEEIARVARFLSSPAASYMTGAVVPVDGGWTA
ncbi:SDR family NAD(P)-dependent oxidoreductase [Granulicoccus phenolivorans]|uniref:SDR family NAD(P)-dependent oxidoreductase n=1 Tax=Granulicoccus phenolivorans TaxID=266854 RepID=UPI000409CB8E|nr:SDR family NAD(P)-dependent oxidoreductase [Granulicoccus phenolivorans]